MAPILQSSGMTRNSKADPRSLVRPLAAALTGLALPIVLMAATATALHAQGSAADKPNILVILDSSRSMWGQIDGINKIVSARDLLAKQAKRLEKTSRFGLMAYGHRQSAGCRDIETLLPVGEHKAAELAKIVDDIRPKGSTPIAAALEEGAKAAESDKQRASIILIADGLDNCKGDPCQAASDVKAKSRGLTIHTIAFDRKEKAALEGLACVAENTGGTFTSATSEGELEAALEKTVDLALNPPQAAASARAAPEEAAPQRAKGGELAALADDGADDGADAGAEPGDVEAEAEETGAIETPAPAEARSNAEENERTAAAAAPVALNLHALLTETGPEIKHGLVWRIFDSKPGVDGRYKLLNTFRDAAPTTELAPGRYLVNAAYGLSHLTKMVTVRGGGPVKETLVLNAGGLRLGAALADGTALPPNTVHYDIFGDDADQFGNREKIIGDAKPGLIIRLNAGVYHVVSTYGDANAIVRADVTVEPGKLTEATVNHAAARVTFKLVNKPGGEALADTRWSIMTPDGSVVKESAGALPTHILAAGRYTVLARYHGKNYSRDFTTKNGEAKQIEVVIR